MNNDLHFLMNDLHFTIVFNNKICKKYVFSLCHCLRNCSMFGIQMIQMWNSFQSQYLFLYICIPCSMIEIYCTIRIIDAYFITQISMYDASVHYFNSFESYHQRSNIITTKFQRCGKYLLPVTKLKKNLLKTSKKHLISCIMAFSCYINAITDWMHGYDALECVKTSEWFNASPDYTMLPSNQHQMLSIKLSKSCKIFVGNSKFSWYMIWKQNQQHQILHLLLFLHCKNYIQAKWYW